MSRGKGFVPLMRSAENGFVPLRRSAENGFTLIEMLVALAIFSLAALAMMRLEGAVLASTTDLDQKQIAQIVARNIAIETLTNPTAPTLGRTQGELINGDRKWHWERISRRTDDIRTIRIDIIIYDQAMHHQAALTIVRPVE